MRINGRIVVDEQAFAQFNPRELDLEPLADDDTVSITPRVPSIYISFDVPLGAGYLDTRAASALHSNPEGLFTRH
ncbi:hypothetical protein RRF57_009131 [Xylaria bambusicola]|uniref:Uncharacterized protein n=1 Tax=Xylaria bambusicola TaxID=326684 RepID=A0AAN7UQG4_9PEZI